MSTTEITGKIRAIKEGFQNGDFNSEETTELLDDLIELRNLVPGTHTRYDKIIENYQNVTDELESAIEQSN